MSAARLRIISDLHYAETGSRLQKLSALEPVLEGADKVVFNGDTLETRFLDIDPRTVGHKAEWVDFAARHGAGGRFILVTGNHDPDLTDTHHLELEGGRILVIHGDTMFPRMAPWGWEAKYFQQQQEQRLDDTPERLYDRKWAMSLIESALGAVQHEYAALGKGAIFDELKSALWGGRGEPAYAGAASRLGMSEGALRVALRRMRNRFGEHLRAEVAKTVVDSAEIDDEVRHLLAAFGR
jgi:predicted phosphodiesterase